MAEAESIAAPSFNVAAYVVEGNPLLSTNVLIPMLSKHTGTNVTLEELVQAASDLHEEYRNRGYPMMSVAIAREQITNGIVTMNVFPTVIPQIVVSGVRYLSFANNLETASNLLAAAPVLSQRPPVSSAATNAGPRFDVEKYLIAGNSVLAPETIGTVITNINGAFGTNVSFDGIRTVLEELQRAYRERGYVTVAVGLPQQKLTNATVKVQVTEGWLTDINVKGNRYFSSNNVMRALPSLDTDTLLNGPILQAELNRANANQDRTIYPVIGPGPELGTSELTLDVKDRLPLHAKVELNNQSSPGTPDMRINTSAEYDNLWQLGHSLGVQYGFSPETYKVGGRWDFYDEPIVANYSAFYRLPLWGPPPIADVVANSPSFGYNEATRKFNLPPPSGSPDLTFFASRATIDTGLGTISSQTFNNVTTTNTSNNTVQQGTLNENTVHEDLTVNGDLGSRLSIPLPSSTDFNSTFSMGLDYKTYTVSSYETNIFAFNGVEIDYEATPPTSPVNYTDYSPVPTTVKQLEYLPLSLRYDANWRDPLGMTAFGVGVSANVWYSGLYSTSSTSTVISTNASGVISTNNVTTTTYSHGATALQQITGSTESSGYWVVINPGFSRDIVIHNWTTSIRADGQWASEPLISNEQFGAGGVNSVRGYHEGEVFGDEGWHVSVEQQTPPHVVGTVYDGEPLTIRGSLYMDYARVYLIDPAGRQGSTPLWGTGFGLDASVGPYWQAQFLFSWPLVSTATTPAYRPFFNFALTAQF